MNQVLLTPTPPPPRHPYKDTDPAKLIRLYEAPDKDSHSHLYSVTPLWAVEKRRIDWANLAYRHIEPLEQRSYLLLPRHHVGSEYDVKLQRRIRAVLNRAREDVESEAIHPVVRRAAWARVKLTLVNYYTECKGVWCSVKTFKLEKM